MTMTRTLILLISSTLLISCSQSKIKTKPQTITVMTYNVENLFDTQDDQNKEDETYLPAAFKNSHPRVKARCSLARKRHWRELCRNTDWTQSRLQRKMERLAEVILQVKDGQGPDILIVEEVENRKVLELLRTQYLQAAHYKPSVLLEGPDKRGIDVGILSRLEQIKPAQLHKIQFKKGNGIKEKDIHPTRGILQATLRLPDGTPLTVFGVHFPSQGSSTPFRRFAIKRLNQLKAQLDKDTLIVVGGDFNISLKEDLRENLYQKDLGPHWAISHKIGCDSCKGTHYYHRHRTWSFLDALLFSPNMLPQGQSRWMVLPKSIRIPRDSLYQTNRYGSPARFYLGSGPVGVSDHWPLAADIVLRNPQQTISSSPSKDL